MYKMKTTELLAPARDLAAGLDAVNCGADAVYIGAEEFGARGNAKNSTADIGKLAAYAHKYRARVYVTVNTLLTDKELPRAQKLIRRVWNAGADAAIVTDMGLLEADLPPIPLISSVLARTSTPEKALFLEKAGFSRVTLSRSLTLEQIKKIRAATSVEFECFVHGGVCVRVSGYDQCYLAYALGGRPDCVCHGAKICRDLYTLKDSSGKVLARDKYLLSVKDLDLSRRLGDLLDAGVSGFKINGRQEGRAFVRNTVSYYRAALDAALKGRGLARSSCGVSSVSFKPDLDKIPNRGYREFFANSREQDIASACSPKSAGDSGFLRKVMRARPSRKPGSAAGTLYKREETVRRKNSFPYPEKELDFSSNILNSKALEFYKRHGVLKAGLLSEAGPDLSGKRLLSAQLCPRPRLGLCAGKVLPGAAAPAGKTEPLYLEKDGERLFRLEFDCASCRMNLFLDKQKRVPPAGKERPAAVRGRHRRL